MFKKTFLRTFIIFLAITALFFIDCKKDESTEPEDSGLVGTWNLTKLTVVSEGEPMVLTGDILSQMGAYWILKFKSDNTFESNYKLEAGPEYETGTWSASGNELSITFDSGGSETFDYTLSGNVLTVSWSDSEGGVEESLTGEFTRQ